MKSFLVFFLTDSTYCWVNFSAEIYKTVLSMYFSLIYTPIACAKWVIPRPTLQKINNGLKEVPPGLLPTAIPADLANLLESPSKKFSKL